MLSVHENPVFENGGTEIKLPKSPKSPRSPASRSDGSGSPASLIFSWRRMRAEQGEMDDEESDPTSPPLWRPGAFMSPNPSQAMSLRAQEIARGRQELMKLYEGMPESAYELSLKDLVDEKTAMEKQQGVNPNAQTTKVVNGNPKKKRPPGHGRKKGTYPTSFLLNIFVPSSFTGRPRPPSRPLSPSSSRIARQNSDQTDRRSSKREAKPTHYKNTLLSLLRIRPSKGSELSPSNSFSKVSPRPYSGKDGQPDQPFMGSPVEPKSNNSSRCSMCNGYTVFFKTNCQACGKIFCSNCVKEAIIDTPEGRRCRATCADKLHSDRNWEPQMKGCWPILSRGRKHSFREEERASM